MILQVIQFGQECLICELIRLVWVRLNEFDLAIYYLLQYLILGAIQFALVMQRVAATLMT